MNESSLSDAAPMLQPSPEQFPTNDENGAGSQKGVPGEVGSFDITERVMKILKDITIKAPNLFQRVEQEVFPLIVNADDTVRGDVFRTIKTRFDLLMKDMRLLEARFSHFEIQTKLNTLAERQSTIMTPERVEKAKQRLMSPFLIDELQGDFEAIGIVGEYDIATVLYLIYQSARMKQPLHVIVKGMSSGGKTTVAHLVLSLLPGDCKLLLASISPRGFDYLDDALTRDKVVYIQEFEGLEAALSTLRVILSEGIATRAVVQTNPVTKSMETVIHSTNHKFVLVTTTTRNFIDHETENRLFCLYVNQKRSHLEKVSQRIRRRHVRKGKQATDDALEIQKLHQVMHKLLMPYEVEIPFADLISFPHSLARHNRDLEKFLRLIEMVAFIRQYQNVIVKRGDEKYVQAGIEDYRIAHRFLISCLREAFDQMPEGEAEVLRIAIRYSREVASESSMGSRGTVPITTRLIREEALKGDLDVGDQTKIGQTLKSLEFRGLVTSNDPLQQGSRRTYYVAEDVDVNDLGELIGIPSILLSQVTSPEELERRIASRASGPEQQQVKRARRVRK